MGETLKFVANSEWRVFRDRQSIRRGKLLTNVTTRVKGNHWVVFQPEEETLFELTTEWLADRGIHARLEAGNPPGNGTACNFEQINAFDSRCDHWHPSET